MNSKTCKDKNIKENKNVVEVDDVKDIDNVLDGLLGDIASEKKDSSLTAEQNFSYGLSNPSSLKLAPSIVASNAEDKGTTSIENTIYIDRGYDDVVGKFKRLGADIWRANDTDITNDGTESEAI